MKVMTALRNDPSGSRPPSLDRRRRGLQHHLEVGEIDPAEGEPDRRHDDVLDERRDHGAERRADDHADREGQGVGLEQEPLELGQHRCPPSSARSAATSLIASRGRCYPCAPSQPPRGGGTAWTRRFATRSPRLLVRRTHARHRQRDARRRAAQRHARQVALSMLNRHGLIAGATGTGKTKTLQLLAGQLSKAGVPVFAADIKGDLSGIALPGDAANPKVQERATSLGWDVRGPRPPRRVPVADGQARARRSARPSIPSVRCCSARCSISTRPRRASSR